MDIRARKHAHCRDVAIIFVERDDPHQRFNCNALCNTFFDTMHLFKTSNFIGPGYHAALLLLGLGSIVLLVLLCSFVRCMVPLHFGSDASAGHYNKFVLFFLKAQEIRSYLKSCGADIKEESTSPLHADLEQLLSACDINFKNESGLFCNDYITFSILVYYSTRVIMDFSFITA